MSIVEEPNDDEREVRNEKQDHEKLLINTFANYKHNNEASLNKMYNDCGSGNFINAIYIARNINSARLYIKFKLFTYASRCESCAIIVYLHRFAKFINVLTPHIFIYSNTYSYK